MYVDLLCISYQWIVNNIIYIVEIKLGNQDIDLGDASLKHMVRLEKLVDYLSSVTYSKYFVEILKKVIISAS